MNKQLSNTEIPEATIKVGDVTIYTTKEELRLAAKWVNKENKRIAKEVQKMRDKEIAEKKELSDRWNNKCNNWRKKRNEKEKYLREELESTKWWFPWKKKELKGKIHMLEMGSGERAPRELAHPIQPRTPGMVTIIDYYRNKYIT